MVGGVVAFLGVGLGALGAHGVKAYLVGRAEPELRLGWWETGARFHLMHGLALLAVAVLVKQVPGRLSAASGWLMVAGVALFSGSLYVMALTGERVWARATPFGGLCFLAGWVCFVLAARRLAA